VETVLIENEKFPDPVKNIRQQMQQVIAKFAITQRKTTEKEEDI